jgi:hypothetical protein
MKPKLTDDEREIILENLVHDLARLDTTTEEEAGKLYDRLVAEGRIDPLQTVEAHRRLLVRLGVEAPLESPQALATGELLRAYGAVCRVRAHLTKEPLHKSGDPCIVSRS